MKIAIAVEGETPESLVADTFEDSACLLIVETDDRSYTVFENPDRPGGSGLGMAQKIIEQDCEALISGTIEKTGIRGAGPGSGHAVRGNGVPCHGGAWSDGGLSTGSDSCAERRAMGSPQSRQRGL